MNVSQIGSPSIPVQPAPTQVASDVKRAALQSMLLKKHLESQQSHADAMQSETDGKGVHLDIRV